MIGFITTPHWSDLILLGCLIVLVVALCYLAIRLIGLAIDAMQQVWRWKPPTEYADFGHEPASDMTAVMDSTREFPDLDEDQVSAEAYGNHAAVPPPTVVETTGYIPRLDRLPVDDAAALRVVDSLSGVER